jgi:hypothetical protein
VLAAGAMHRRKRKMDSTEQPTAEPDAQPPIDNARIVREYMSSLRDEAEAKINEAKMEISNQIGQSI